MLSCEASYRSNVREEGYEVEKEGGELRFGVLFIEWDRRDGVACRLSEDWVFEDIFVALADPERLYRRWQPWIKANLREGNSKNSRWRWKGCKSNWTAWWLPTGWLKTFQTPFPLPWPIHHIFWSSWHKPLSSASIGSYSIRLLEHSIELLESLPRLAACPLLIRKSWEMNRGERKDPRGALEGGWRERWGCPYSKQMRISASVGSSEIRDDGKEGKAKSTFRKVHYSQADPDFNGKDSTLLQRQKRYARQKLALQTKDTEKAIAKNPSSQSRSLISPSLRSKPSIAPALPHRQLLPALPFPTWLLSRSSQPNSFLFPRSIPPHPPHLPRPLPLQSGTDRSHSTLRSD